MPHTTLVASSCAITLPPAATISAAPRVPSLPMPVRTTASSPRPNRRRRREQGIHRRLAEIDRRVVAERDPDAVAAAHHPHMAAARRQVDAAGQDRFAVLGFVRAAAAEREDARRAPS